MYVSVCVYDVVVVAVCVFVWSFRITNTDFQSRKLCSQESYLSLNNLYMRVLVKSALATWVKYLSV